MDSNNLQLLWDAHRELTALHNRLRVAGCDAACKKIATAMRSVNATYAAESKRVDARAATSSATQRPSTEEIGDAS